RDLHVTGVQTCALPILPVGSPDPAPPAATTSHAAELEEVMHGTVPHPRVGPPQGVRGRHTADAEWCDTGGMREHQIRITGRPLRSEERRVGKGGRSRRA